MRGISGNPETWPIVEEEKNKQKLGKKKICTLVQNQQENEQLSHTFSNNNNT